MRTSRIVTAVGLALALSAGALALAAPKRANTQSVAINPTSMLSPVSNANCMRVCLSGFAEGNFVMIGVPWTGTPEYHSNLGFSKYVDATGAFCIDAPPDWTTLSLWPGTYTVDTFFYKDGSGSNLQRGPSATFTVTGN